MGSVFYLFFGSFHQVSENSRVSTSRRGSIRGFGPNGRPELEQGPAAATGSCASCAREYACTLIWQDEMVHSNQPAFIPGVSVTDDIQVATLMINQCLGREHHCCRTGVHDHQYTLPFRSDKSCQFRGMLPEPPHDRCNYAVAARSTSYLSNSARMSTRVLSPSVTIHGRYAQP